MTCTIKPGGVCGGMDSEISQTESELGVHDVRHWPST